MIKSPVLTCDLTFEYNSVLGCFGLLFGLLLIDSKLDLKNQIIKINNVTTQANNDFICF